MGWATPTSPTLVGNQRIAARRERAATTTTARMRAHTCLQRVRVKRRVKRHLIYTRENALVLYVFSAFFKIILYKKYFYRNKFFTS